MLPRLLLVTTLLALLLGCTADRSQIETCRAILGTIIEGPGAVQASEGEALGSVRLAFTEGGAQRELECRFAKGPYSSGHLELAAVTINGVALSGLRLVVLRHVLRLAAPPEEEPEQPLDRSAAYLLQLAIDGLSFGAVIALVAIGYSLVYGITETIQFAYGDIFMIGAMVLVVLLYLFTVLGGGAMPLLLLLALPLAALVTSLYGWTIAHTIYAPLRHASPVNGLVAGVGLSIALREFVRLAQGGRQKWLPEILRGRFVVFEGGGFDVYLAQSQIAILTLALLLGGGLAYLLIATRWGRAHRACADDPKMAALLGVDLPSVIAQTFALGAAVAALAGTVVTLHYGEADFFMGFLMGFKALTAAMLGGIGSLFGALLGGLLLGLTEAFWAGYFGSAYKDFMSFGVLVLVLVFRPSGLLGRALP